ncbi:MAG: DUF4292 domain-containing protein [bacterium]
MRHGSTWFGLFRRPTGQGRMVGPSVGTLILFLVQCAPFLSRPPIAMDATPEQILEAIAKNVEQLHDLEGKVKVRVDASEVHETAVAKIVYRKPDWLKVEVKGFLGVTVANIQMKGDTVWVYYPMSNFLVRGRPTAENFELMTGIRLDVGDLQSVILGEVGLAPEALDHLTDFGVENQVYLLSFLWDGRSQKHWVDPKLLVVTRSEFYDHQGNLQLRQTYTNYEKFRDVQLPTKIEILKGGEQHRLVLALKEGKVNRGIPEDRFRLNLPTDVERIELSN